MTKTIFTILLLTLSIVACKKNQAQVENKNSSAPIYSFQDATKFQGEAMSVYNTNADMAARLFLKAAEAYIQNGYKKDAGICFSNAAHLYEESFNKLDSALLISKKGLEYSIMANDTANVGHGHRYTGFLLGMNGKVKEGIAEIEKSYAFYNLRNNKDAVAVADYDMARVYFQGGFYKEAVKALTKSSDHFKAKMNLQRLFLNNIFAITLAKKSGDTNLLSQAKLENDNLINSGKISNILKSKYQEALK
jgi:tetratricopeptide (TPR) repeat protein